MPGAAGSGIRSRTGRWLPLGRAVTPPVLLGTAGLLATVLVSGCSGSGGSALPGVEKGTPRNHVTYHPGSNKAAAGDPDFPDAEVGSQSELEAKIQNDSDKSQKVDEVGVKSQSSAAGAAGRRAPAVRRAEIEKPYDGCSGKTLEPGKSCQVLFRYAPTKQGSHTAAFMVDFAGSTPDIHDEVSAVALPPEGSTPPPATTGSATPPPVSPTPSATLPTDATVPVPTPTGPADGETPPPVEPPPVEPPPNPVPQT